MTNKVAVALSGGIDSSVTALLLKQQGYDVVGITAKTTNSENSELVICNARNVAKKIDISFFPIDVTELFHEKVIDYYETSYKKGETPNPCIMCNKYVKWGILFDYAINTLNADFIATGHYANIVNDNGIYKLYPASDEHKDQLYFLFMLNQKQLKQTLFPLSKYKKSEVKQIAIDYNLPSKSSKESQDLCFIEPPMTTKKYLNKICKPKEGLFIEKTTGNVLGKHSGFWQYTVGQRKGIGIAALKPLYVTSTDSTTNTVYVGYKEELFSNELILRNINWNYPINKEDFNAFIKIRYNMKAIPAHVKIINNSVNISFTESISAIAKGQACVIYDENDGHMLGGAFIE